MGNKLLVHKVPTHYIFSSSLVGKQKCFDHLLFVLPLLLLVGVVVIDDDCITIAARSYGSMCALIIMKIIIISIVGLHLFCESKHT